MLSRSEFKVNTILFLGFPFLNFKTSTWVVRTLVDREDKPVIFVFQLARINQMTK